MNLNTIKIFFLCNYIKILAELPIFVREVFDYFIKKIRLKKLLFSLMSYYISLIYIISLNIFLLWL
jgi:hypothetical protein